MPFPSLNLTFEAFSQWPDPNEEEDPTRVFLALNNKNKRASLIPLRRRFKWHFRFFLKKWKKSVGDLQLWSGKGSHACSWAEDTCASKLARKDTKRLKFPWMRNIVRSAQHLCNARNIKLYSVCCKDCLSAHVLLTEGESRAIYMRE